MHQPTLCCRLYDASSRAAPTRGAQGTWSSRRTGPRLSVVKRIGRRGDPTTPRRAGEPRRRRLDEIGRQASVVFRSSGPGTAGVSFRMRRPRQSSMHRSLGVRCRGRRGSSKKAAGTSAVQIACTKVSSCVSRSPFRRRRRSLSCRRV